MWYSLQPNKMDKSSEIDFKFSIFMRLMCIILQQENESKFSSKKKVEKNGKEEEIMSDDC